MHYKTIGTAVSNEIIIKKSRFISLLIPLDELQDAEKYLLEARQNYPGANHYCFAYILRDNSHLSERCSDDREPSGTAGWPILNVLKKNHLENLLAIVIRYFGGTLLGTGGLVKAYTQSVQSVLDKAQIITMKYCQKVIINLDYTHYGAYEKHFALLNKQVIDIEYTDKVKIKLWLEVENLADFLNRVDDLSLGSANVELLEKDYIPQ